MRFPQSAILLAFLWTPAFCFADDARTRGRTENVLFVMTDGLRWQEVFTGADEALLNKKDGGVGDVPALRKAFWRDTPDARREALMPFMWIVIAKEGQLYGNAAKGSVARVTNGKQFSYPGYQETLCGFPDPAIDSNDKLPNKNVSVLEWLNNKPQYNGRIAAFCSWDVFPFILNRDRSGLLVNAGYEPLQHGTMTPRIETLNQLMRETAPFDETTRFDSFTFYLALEFLKTAKPRVLFISFDDTDHQGHAGRYDRMLHAARRTDQYLRVLWETAQSMPEYAGKTTLIFAPDHGRGRAPRLWREHGRTLKEAENIWIGIMGPDTPPLGERSNVETVTQGQIAATLAALLGEDYCAAQAKAAKPISEVTGLLRR